MDIVDWLLILPSWRGVWIQKNGLYTRDGSSSFGSAELHPPLRHRLRLWKLPDVDSRCWAGSIAGPPRPIEPMGIHKILKKTAKLMENCQAPRERQRKWQFEVYRVEIVSGMMRR
jgi:hypothetical protein